MRSVGATCEAKTESGLVMPTFNRELAALTDEAMDLEPTEGEE